MKPLENTRIGEKMAKIAKTKELRDLVPENPNSPCKTVLLSLQKVLILVPDTPSCKISNKVIFSL